MSVLVDKKALPDRSTVWRFAAFLLILSFGFTADLVTKHHAFRSLGMPGEYGRGTETLERPDLYGTRWVFDGLFGFQTTLNEGALYGMFQGKVHVFTVFSLVAIIGIGFWLYYGALRSRLITVTLGMVSAGILGNLYDRLGIHGLRWNYANDIHAAGDPVYAVRDWILVMIGSYHWPNFNIADSLLVCGAILLLFYAVFYVEDGSRPSEHEASASESG